MKILQAADVVSAPDFNMIAMSISEHKDYKTKAADGTYDIDVYIPDLERAATVNVKSIDESVRVMRAVHFEGLNVKLSAPKQWEITVKLTADSVKGV